MYGTMFEKFKPRFDMQDDIWQKNDRPILCWPWAQELHASNRMKISQAVPEIYPMYRLVPHMNHISASRRARELGKMSKSM